MRLNRVLEHSNNLQTSEMRPTYAYARESRDSGRGSHPLHPVSSEHFGE